MEDCSDLEGEFGIVLGFAGVHSLGFHQSDTEKWRQSVNVLLRSSEEEEEKRRGKKNGDSGQDFSIWQPLRQGSDRKEGVAVIPQSGTKSLEVN